MEPATSPAPGSPLLLPGPAWPGVRMACTTRAGGASAGPFGGFNLGAHVGDEPAAVAANRERLQRLLPGAPRWLEQVHGTAVADVDALPADAVPRADAAVTRRPGTVLAIMTADCLPVVIADARSSVLAVAHAGWRGLLAGVLEQAVTAMAVGPGVPVRAWLGPAIGPQAFEVGDEVRAAFVAEDPACACAFAATGGHDAQGAPKWLADLPALAQHRLRRAGVGVVVHSGLCTVAESDRFFSYRRDGRTGRFATLAWLEA
ncbi:peptidoglycan editing factor PgeF [Pigmentiphaga soli]|uniref:Purine nucleoside phosphorylase n=1 Tax=Pigmentiphaga soli TaxID=1007095 RepID=A0ABP8HDJ1_9BURK